MLEHILSKRVNTSGNTLWRKNVYCGSGWQEFTPWKDSLLTRIAKYNVPHYEAH